jgi:hypothetical protein
MFLLLVLNSTAPDHPWPRLHQQFLQTQRRQWEDLAAHQHLLVRFTCVLSFFEITMVAGLSITAESWSQ